VIIIKIVLRMMPSMVISCKEKKGGKVAAEGTGCRYREDRRQDRQYFSIARSRRFLYWGTRGSTEIVIGRCELFPKAVEEGTTKYIRKIVNDCGNGILYFVLE